MQPLAKRGRVSHAPSHHVYHHPAPNVSYHHPAHHIHPQPHHTPRVLPPVIPVLPASIPGRATNPLPRANVATRWSPAAPKYAVGAFPPLFQAVTAPASPSPAPLQVPSSGNVSPALASILNLGLNQPSMHVAEDCLTPHAEDTLQPGVVVEFRTTDGETRLGLITRRKAVDLESDADLIEYRASTESWLVTECPEVEASASPLKTYEIDASQVKFVWPLKYAKQTYRYDTSILFQLRRHVQGLVEQHRYQLAVAWGSCIDREQPHLHVYSFAWMLFPESEPKPHELYVAHRLLHSEGKTYFEQVGKYRYRAKSFASVESDKKQTAAGSTVVATLSSPPPKEAPVRSDNPYLEMFPHIIEFPSRIRLPTAIDRDARFRRDMRRFGPLLAIDNSLASDEIDDAVSVDERPDGSSWVYVHIADPSRLVAPNDEVDVIVRNRAQSVFLPEKSVLMFPSTMARNQLSLLSGKVNYALSFGLRFDSKGHVLDYEIVPSVIGSVHNMTYDQADEILKTSDPTNTNHTKHRQVLQKLRDFASAHKQNRLSRGAVFLDTPRGELSVKNNGEAIELHVSRDQRSASRTTVSELMIAVGEVTARFAKKHNLAIPYRAQRRRNPAMAATAISTAMSAEQSTGDGWGHVLAQLDQMMSLGAAVTRPDPQPHHGLGVDVYCQATSPIRRYYDLLVHQQVKSVIRNEEPPFDLAKMQDIITQVEGTQNELNELAQGSHRYWLMRYLEKQDPMKVFLGLVTGLDVAYVPTATSDAGSAASVLFLDLGWRTNLNIRKGAKRGDLLKFSIAAVDAKANQLEWKQLQ